MYVNARVCGLSIKIHKQWVGNWFTNFMMKNAATEVSWKFTWDSNGTFAVINQWVYLTIECQWIFVCKVIVLYIEKPRKKTWVQPVKMCIKESIKKKL